MKKTMILSLLILTLSSCKIYKKTDTYKYDFLPLYRYSLLSSHDVEGRQGIACFEDGYIISDNKKLFKYDKEWNLVQTNDNAFEGLDIKVNHISDIDVYNHEIYAGCEYFYGLGGTNIHMMVFDLDTLEFLRYIPFEKSSSQKEFSSLTINQDDGLIVCTSWGTDYSSKYLYLYSLNDEKYAEKVKIDNSPCCIQGIKYYKGHYFLSCDDSAYSSDKKDNIYRVDLSEGKTSICIEQSYFNNGGEIEGISMNDGQLVFIYNKTTNFVEKSVVYEYSFVEEENV